MDTRQQHLQTSKQNIYVVTRLKLKLKHTDRFPFWILGNLCEFESEWSNDATLISIQIRTEMQPIRLISGEQHYSNSIRKDIEFKPSYL